MEDSLQMPFLTASGNWGTWAFSFPQLGKGKKTQKKKKKRKRTRKENLLLFSVSLASPPTHITRVINSCVYLPILFSSPS